MLSIQKISQQRIVLFLFLKYKKFVYETIKIVKKWQKMFITF